MTIAYIIIIITTLVVELFRSMERAERGAWTNYIHAVMCVCALFALLRLIRG